MAEQTNPLELLPLVTNIVSAHVTNNSVPVGELPQLIRDVYLALSTISVPPAAAPERPAPAVPVKKSVTPDYIICLEDGKKLKMLKRYLRSTYGMSPDEYRTKWALPPDYPMVAPKYAEQRSAIARRTGLGRRPRAD